VHNARPPGPGSVDAHCALTGTRRYRPARPWRQSRACRVKSSNRTWSTNTLLAMMSDEDRAILDFEGRWWLEPGPKDQAIEFTLGLSAEAYYERLIAIVAVAESSRIYPLTVARIKAMIQPDRAGEAAVS
jgi:hypothetical protein